MALITCQIMRHEKIRHLETLGEIGEKLENLRADQHIERGDGLIECDHGGFRDQCSCNRDPLALAAREFPRQTPRIGSGQSDLLQNPGHLASTLRVEGGELNRKNGSPISCSTVHLGSKLP